MWLGPKAGIASQNKREKERAKARREKVFVDVDEVVLVYQIEQ